MFRQLLFFVAVLFISLTAFSQESTSLPHSKPAAQQAVFFSSFQKEINAAVPSVGSFLVWQHNALLYEHYFHDCNRETAFNIKSITKSILSAIGGIAKDKGILPVLNTPVVNMLPEYAPPSAYAKSVVYREDRAWHDSLRRIMTLQDLLTMRTGLAWDDFGPTVTNFIFSSDPVRFVMEVPFEEEPGQTFNYCSGASAVFEAVLAKLLPVDVKLFADSNLFHPIGIDCKRWDTDPTGRYFGASEMFLTAQELMKFGLLYLHNGKINGSQIISQSRVKESQAAHATLNKWPVLPFANGYGYYWWRRKTNGCQAYVASGACGQLICIVPKQDMVIVTTCLINEKNRGRSEIKLLHSFIDKVTKQIKN